MTDHDLAERIVDTARRLARATLRQVVNCKSTKVLDFSALEDTTLRM